MQACGLIVGAVGDGANDAPMLHAAHVGIALVDATGNEGSDDGSTDENQAAVQSGQVRPPSSSKGNDAVWGDAAALRAAPFTALGGSLVGLPGMRASTHPPARIIVRRFISFFALF
jgi:magnesium-transporting ATPase (P-type)